MSLQDALHRTLTPLERHGTFAATGTVPSPLLLLAVDGVGPLAFPLPPEQASRLRAAATPAPHGRGTRTLVDDTVRQTGQFSPEQIQHTTLGWSTLLDGIVAQAALHLGIEGAPHATLYKLLVYGPGDHFVVHRDTEKEDHMVATLVVTLPSSWQGGDLVIQMGPESLRAPLKGEHPGLLHWAAFYCDCRHALEPVAEGHRIALVYNLVSDHPSVAPDHRGPRDALAAAFRSWEHDHPMALWPLEHKYTDASLSWSALKGPDAARAWTLAAAAEDAGLEVALVTLSRWSQASGWDNSRSHWRSREPVRIDDVHVEEEFDADEHIEGWLAPDGRCIADRVSGDIDALLGENWYEEEDPDEFDYHEATGNEGATIERTWKRTAVVVLQADSKASVLADGGWEAAGPVVVLAAGGDPDAMDLALAVTEHWLHQRHDAAFRVGQVPILSLWKRAGCRDLMEDWAVSVGRRNPPDIDSAESVALVLLDLEPGQAAELVGHWAHTHSASVLRVLVWMLDYGLPQAALVPILGAVHDTWTTSRPSAEPRWMSRRTTELDAEAAADLIQLLAVVDPALADRVWTTIWAQPKRWPRRQCLVPAALDRAQPAPGLVERLSSWLAEETAEAPTLPANATRDRRLGCDCPPCSEVNAFLAHPIAMEHTLRVRQSLRRHVRDQARYAGADLRFQTIRKSSPFPMVCTKTTDSAEARIDRYEADIAALTELRG